MKIAVFGTGMVGQAIAGKLHQLNHEVVVGTRDPEQTLSRDGKNSSFRDWYAAGRPNMSIATFADAAASAGVIFNCTSGSGSIQALQLAGSAHLEGKVLVDVSNPLDFSKGSPPFLNPGNTDSLGELIQRTFPSLRVVKSLNTMTCYLMINPGLVPGSHNVFMSGNNAEAKEIVSNLLQSFGWRAETILDLGDITTARGTEQLLPIWLRLWGKLKSPMFNFNIVVAPSAT